jgi:hypothetical protein
MSMTYGGQHRFPVRGRHGSRGAWLQIAPRIWRGQWTPRGAWFALVLTATLITGCAPADGPAEPGNVSSAAETSADPADAAAADAGSAPAGATDQAARVSLPETELAAGWIALFDGHSLFGWQPAGDANWRVQDGAIVVDAGDKCLLCTTSQFGDYELRVDFRCPLSTNSGIFLHTPPQPEDPAVDCYELNIAGPENPFPTASLVHRQKAELDPVDDDWHTYHVTVDQGQVTVQLDGRQVLQYVDPKPLLRGHIGLQFNTGEIAFRKISLRPLETESMFNGQDLSGWKTYPEMDSKFTVNEAGHLHVENGRGQLETEAAYGDFVLQLECLTHADGLNSGVFFRCIPGDVMMGYECQIHNGYQNGDRTQPVDCGTGGFFRRQDARYVVADDQQWFTLTLVAHGPHMAAWVDGYQVSDWTDQREPDENPRKGLRLEPGTIMIQGHDPTTDLSFRNLRIAALAERQVASGGASSNSEEQ